MKKKNVYSSNRLNIDKRVTTTKKIIQLIGVDV